MRYLSICSGIEAASVAWRPLGWQTAAVAEVDPFPCAVLQHRFPNVPNWGDITKLEGWPDATVDVLVGGTPCQSFSIAGLRAGLADPRGALVHAFAGIAARYRPRWIVWENVPGVLSVDGGRTFAGFLRGLGDVGYQCAWRVFDAQYFNLAQRRARVFVVGYLGDWRPAAAVLVEPESLRGDPAPRRASRQDVARPVASGSGSSGGYRNDADTADNLIVGTLQASMGKRGGIVDECGSSGLVAGTIGPHSNSGRSYGSNPVVATPFDTTQITSAQNRSQPKPGDPCCPLTASGHAPAVAFEWPPELADPITANEGSTYTHEGSRNFRLHNVVDGVRRLTPRECERLQGFSDDWTLIPYRGKPAKDGPRYRAIGNSMPVPVMSWIGGRIQAVESILGGRKPGDGA